MTRKIVNQKIEELRKNKGLTQSEFAEKLGMEGQKGRSSVNNWEYGTVQVKSDDLIKIATVFDVTVDWLLGLAKSPTREGTKQAAEIYTGLSGEAMNTLHSFLGEGNERSLETLIVDSLLKTSSFKNKFLQALINVFLNECDAQRTISATKESDFPMIEAEKMKGQFRQCYDRLRIANLDYNESCQELLYDIFPELKTITEELRSVVDSKELNQADINEHSFTYHWKRRRHADRIAKAKNRMYHFPPYSGKLKQKKIFEGAD